MIRIPLRLYAIGCIGWVCLLGSAALLGVLIVRACS